MAIVTASARGQIVIPKEIRTRLKIKPGKKTLMKVKNDQAILTPLPDDPVDHFCGIFEEGPSLTKALLAERKQERNHEVKKVLDSFAFLAFLNRESAYDRVRQCLYMVKIKWLI